MFKAPSRESLEPDGARPGGAHVKHQPSNICIIDDETHLLELFEQALEQEGHNVNAFPNREAFLEFAAIEQPDLLLLDLTLPGHDAWAMQQQLGPDNDLADMTVIGVTGRSQPTLEATATETLGIEALLEKPFSMTELLEATNNALQRDP